MRLDLFLKTSRLVKRRATARALCDSGNVQVNGHQAKPSREIRQRDLVTVQFSSRTIEFEVLSIQPAGRQQAGDELYRVIRESRPVKEQDHWNENR